MRGKLEYSWDDFSGGLRNNLSPGGLVAGLVKPNELTRLNDMTFDRESRMMRRRNGHHNQLTYGPTFTSMFGARGLTAGAASQLILADGAAGSVYSFTVGGGLTAAILSGLTAGRQYEFAQGPVSGGQGPLYMVNGGENRQYTGAAGAAWTASAGTLPLGYYILWHGNRMWVARMDTYAPTVDPKSTLTWSGLADPRDWASGGNVMFDPNDGDRITGIGKIGPYLLVFKTTKTWLVYDLDTGANRQLSGEVGAISHRAIVETRKGTYFLTRDRGLAVCDGSTIKFVEDKINIIDDLDVTLAGTNYTSWMTQLGDRLYMQFVLAGGSFSPLYEYVIEGDSWWPTSRQMYQSVIWDGNGKPEMWGVDPLTKILTRLFVRAGADQRDYNNLDINAYFRTSLTDLRSDRRKRMRAVTLQGPMNGIVTPIIDGVNAFPTAFNTTPVAGSYPRAKIPRPIATASGRRWQFEVSVADQGAPARFEPAVITLHADPRAD